MEDEKLCSPKTFSAATSPIKDSHPMRYGSRELGLMKKLVNRDVQTEKYQTSGIFHSSSSSEKVQIILVLMWNFETTKVVPCFPEN